MNHWVHDYETLQNCFVAVFEHYITKAKRIFIVHYLKNDFWDLVKFLQSNARSKEWHVSYNGLAFDSQITQFILKNHYRWGQKSADEIARILYQYAQKVISTMNNRGFSDYPVWKLDIKQVDLFKMNHWDSMAKLTSLKWLQYAIDWHNLEEMPIHHTTEIHSHQEIATIVSYCENDVEVTKRIMHMSYEGINLRQTLTDKYDINLYSASETKLAKELFSFYICQGTGMDKKVLRELRTPRGVIYGKDLILPYVQFKTPEFQDAHQWFKNLVLDYSVMGNLKDNKEKEKIKYVMDYMGCKTDYGLGGVHGVVPSGVYEADDDNIIITSDVVSYYPNLIIRNRWAPEHLPTDLFCDQFEGFFNDRLKIPKSNPMNYVYKILLNSTYGLSSDKNSFLYDPKLTMQVTLNGQLLLSMLYERLSLEIPGCKPLMQNTDGLEMRIPKEYYDRYMKICEEWEQQTQLKLEHDQYAKIVIGDVNNYIAKNTSGEVKSKGRFEWEAQEKKKVAILHKNKSFLVIPKALNKYFMEGIKPEDYLASNTNIFDYCAGVKAKGEWRLKLELGDRTIAPERLVIHVTQKRAFLRANGWQESWSADNWVRADAINKEANTGLSTHAAYRMALEREAITEERILQNIVRYYAGTNRTKGGKLIKFHSSNGKRMQVEASHDYQVVCNKINKRIPFEQFEVDKEYYLNRIYREIDNIERKKTKVINPRVKAPTEAQMSLF